MGLKVRRGKESYVYALKLQCGFIYVGLTYNVDKRVREHYEGKGSVFTSRFKPVGIHSVLPLGKVSAAEASAAENIYTIELILKYSQNKIRGGGYAAMYRKKRSRAVWERLLVYWKRYAKMLDEYSKWGGYSPWTEAIGINSY